MQNAEGKERILEAETDFQIMVRWEGTEHLQTLGITVPTYYHYLAFRRKAANRR